MLLEEIKHQSLRSMKQLLAEDEVLQGNPGISETGSGRKHYQIPARNQKMERPQGSTERHTRWGPGTQEKRRSPKR